jgi:hypothetical protein
MAVRSEWIARSGVLNVFSILCELQTDHSDITVRSYSVRIGNSPFGSKVIQAGINLVLSVVRKETACNFGIVQMVTDVVDTQRDET